MLRQAMYLAIALLVAAAYALLASCQAPLTMTGDATGPTVEAKLTGTPQQLVAFDKALRPQLGDEPMGCMVSVNGADSDCDALQSVPPSSTLKDLTYAFYGPHTVVYEKLGAAFNQVQPSPGAVQASDHLTLAITHRSGPSKAPDCSLKPQPCVSAPFCVQYGGCSKQKVPCTKC